MKRLSISLVLLLVLLLPSVLSTVDAATPYGYADFIWIKPDGTVEGTSSLQRNGDVYKLTEDVLCNVGAEQGFILVQKNNIVIDGAGHTIQGNNSGTAIYLRGAQNVTVQNFNVKGFAIGVNFYAIFPPPPSIDWPLQEGAQDNKILNNNITAVYPTGTIDPMLAGWGILLEFAGSTVVSGNTIASASPQKGVFVSQSCADSSFLNNRFLGCTLNFYRLSQNTIVGNTVDEKALVYLNGATNQVIDGAAQVLLFNCNSMTVKNVHPTVDYGKAIQLSATTNTEVTNCEGRVFLENSSNNTIHDNSPKTIELSGSSYNRIYSNTALDSGVCLKLYGSSNHNDIYQNNFSNSKTSSEATSLHNSGRNADGIRIGDSQLGCQHNNIYLNTLANNDIGIESYSSSENNIYANSITNCNVGISLGSSHQNRISENNITDAYCGISIHGASSSNAFYHNNFVNDTKTAAESHETLLSPIQYDYSSNNTWDNGYPSGGNFYSDYNGSDVDGDGIGDAPYNVYENYTDHYPLMNIFTSETHTAPSLYPSASLPSPTTSPTTLSGSVQSTPTGSVPTQSSTPASTTSPSASEKPDSSPVSESAAGLHAEAIYFIAAVVVIAIVASAVFALIRRRRHLA